MSHMAYSNPRSVPYTTYMTQRTFTEKQIIDAVAGAIEDVVNSNLGCELSLTDYNDANVVNFYVV